LCRDEIINLDVRELPPLRQLCFFLQSKIVRVTGNVGAGLCQAGCSGNVHLVGDASSHLGQDMNGSEVEVDGDGGILVGNGMRKGVIRLNRDYLSLGRVIGGEIYHLGNRIV
jgi:formylmethanofuran dehydrogenase subunit C